MIKVDRKDSKLSLDLKAKLHRLDNLQDVDSSAMRAVVKANKGIKFRKGHRASHILVEAGRVELGSYAPGYFKLLLMPVDKLSMIYTNYIITGSTRG